MSKVDNELTQRFQRAERPVDGDGVFEGLGARRSHRERVRRVQAGLVAFAVLAATAGGFAILQEAFDSGERDVGVSPSPDLLPTNGEIVFVREGADGRTHVFAAQPDGSGVRQITNGATDDSDPAVSPDGQNIAYVSASDEEGVAIAIAPFDGGGFRNLTDGIFADDPAWSPDGSELAFVTSGVDSMLLQIITTNGSSPRYLLDVALASIASPSWSPDGTRIAFGLLPEGSPGSVGIIPTNTMAKRPLGETLGGGSAPAWSPDGSKIAIMRSGNEGDEVWIIDLDGGSEVQLAAGLGTSLEPDLAWAPDGTALLVSDGEWIYRVNATPGGDPRDDFERLVEGRSPAWQPLSVEQEPSVTTRPEPEGRDIGLGVQMCDLEVIEGIDWDGTGIDGSAWTGAPVDQDGRCSSPAGVQHIVAVDRDGDGIAEQGSTSTLRTCLLCQPFDTVDLNDDGVLELVVLEEASSTPTYSVYEVNRPGSERSPGVYPIIVVAPGAPAMNLDKNEAVRFTVGGDEGFSGSIECEDAGAGAPILRYTWVRGAVDADTELRVDIARLRFGEDGVFHIESVDRFSVPRDPEPTDLKSTEPACGVDFHPAA
jgi:WD40-like Beta Propeller Repeat